jgi:rubrerythrin
MPRACEACGGARRVQRALKRKWWETILQRPSVVDELCGACGGIGVVRGTPEEEEAFERQRQARREEQERQETAERARRQEELKRREAAATRRASTPPPRPPSAVRVSGPSRFWRCPGCRGILQKNDPLPGLSRYDSVIGSVTCGACGHSVPRDRVYGGVYDVAEVQLTCPYCSTVLRGPAEMLLGKACPSCTRNLPPT